MDRIGLPARRAPRCRVPGARRALLGIVLSLLCLTHVARADGESSIWDLEVHGFVSQGFILTTRNNYLARSKRGSAEFSEVGINFSKAVTDKLRFGLQLFSGDLGPVGNYSIQADWYYVDYRFANELGFRAGRIKLPLGLYNEIQDTDAARVPVILPSAVYAANKRNFLLAHTGGELYGHLSLAAAGALEYRLYGGTIYTDLPPQPPTGPLYLSEMRVPYIVGGRLLWETPLEGLRLAGSVQATRVQFETYANPPPVYLGTWDWHPIVVGVGSLEYAFRDLMLSAEYRRAYVKIRLGDIEASVIDEGVYGMLSWRLADWLQPGAYYSVYFPNTKHRHGRERQQHDLGATLRFDVNPNWLFKLEGHYMVGTAGVEPELNEQRSRAELTRRWMAFFAKTTVYF